MTAPTEDISPIVERAVAECADLAAAAEIIGTADPTDAIKQIDGDPDRIRDFAESATSSMKSLDAAIDEAQAALDKQKDKAEGDGSDSAVDEAEAELDELKSDRDRLESTIDKVRRIADELNSLLTNANTEIVHIAGQADPAVQDVLAGRFGSADGDSESQVNAAVMAVIDVAQKVDGETERLCDEFDDLEDKATDTERGGKTDDGGDIERGDETD